MPVWFPVKPFPTLQLQIKRTTALWKLMDAYCKKQGINRTSVSFHFDGKRIEDDKAAAEVTVFCRGAVLLAVFHFTVCILIVLIACNMKWRMMM